MSRVPLIRESGKGSVIKYTIEMLFLARPFQGHLGKGRFQTCPFTLKIIAKSYLTSYIENNLLNHVYPSEEKIRNG